MKLALAYFGTNIPMPPTFKRGRQAIVHGAVGPAVDWVEELSIAKT